MHSPLSGLARLRRARTRRFSSYDRRGGNRDWIEIPAGARAEIAMIAGAGCIRHLWITVNHEDPLSRRNLVLRAFWDGEDQPSVECPLGDFFGQGWAERYNFASLPLAAAPREGHALNCYFPMPFAGGARIEIENQSELPVSHFYFYVDYEELDELEPETGRFHAWWNRALTQPHDQVSAADIASFEVFNQGDSQNHLILDAQGRGHYVGMNYYVDSPSPLWYGEGDDMFLVDGEPWPGSLHGTGTEDYVNTAWGPAEEYQHPYFGYAQVRHSFGWLGRAHAYRFHLEDPVHFQSSLRASIEHGHANNLTLDLATVAYWYQTEPHKSFPALPPRDARRPMPPIEVTDIHRWRDAWRRTLGGGNESPWGNERG
jgi:hypothetical protein